jgi:hypothetical protein
MICWAKRVSRFVENDLSTAPRSRPPSYSDRLSTLFAEGGAFREIYRADGMALMEMKDGAPSPPTLSAGVARNEESRRRTPAAATILID